MRGEVMNPERWRRIETILDELLDLPAAQRAAALERADGEDAALRGDVERLLAACLSEEGLVSEPAAALLAPLLGDVDPRPPNGALELEPGERVGRFRVIRILGRGGMGVVYLARDPELDRPVALKLLRLHLTPDPEARRRLLDEARAAAALDHPRIETIYEVGTTADGRLFIAMACYEGETLRDRIARGPMPVDAAIELGVQLAEGLGAAHRSRVVHRDIKPGNLLVTRDGVLKILDFGIAKVMREGLASVGLPLGTAAYMSPEQTRGEAVDHRTDLWSAGVVLYEMLAGSRPFGGEGEALIHAIRNDPPPLLSAIREDLPPALVATVERCLDKDPDRRFESADALAWHLRSALSGGDALTPTRRRDPDIGSRARRRLVGIVATTVLAAGALVIALVQGGREVAPSALVGGASPGIAVMPFEVRGEGLDVWREGMVDLLSVGLDGAAELRAIDSRTVLARWKQLAGAGEADLAISLRVARAAGARYAILGSVVPVGADLRLVADVYDAERGRRLGQAQVDGSQEDVLELVDRLAIRSLGAILEKDRGLPEIDMTSITSTSLPAVKEYLGGELHLRRGEYREAIAAYQRAVDADSTFPLGWFGLGQALGWVEGSANPLGPEAMERAANARVLPERQALVARAYLADGTALEPLRLAVRKYPDDARMWYALGELYFHLPELALIGPEETATAFRRAVELDPGFAPYWVHFINLAFFLDPDSARVGGAIDAYARVASEVRGHRLAHDLAFGDRDTRVRARDALEVADDEILLTAYLDLQHPRYYGEIFPLLEDRLRRAPPHMQQDALHDLVRQRLWAGTARQALAHLADPRTEESPDHVSCSAYRAFTRGIPIPPANLERLLSAALIDSSTGLWIGCIGAWAADRGRWADHARVIETLRGMAGRSLASEVSLGGRRLEAVAAALEGYAAWKRGRPGDALRLLESARPDLGSYLSSRALPHAWWTAQILLELGRPAEAARYFRAQWADPLAHHELAKIYHALGQEEKARSEYEFFIVGWTGADPELQPVVSQARAAVAELGGAGRP